MPQALKLHATDNVAVCTAKTIPGNTVVVIASDGQKSEVTSVGTIEFCNKIALLDIPSGAPIRKYGEVIGVATADIAKGALVNHDNIASQPRAYKDEYLLGA